MRGKLIIGLGLTLVLIFSLVVTHSDTGVSVKKISNNIDIYMNFSGALYDNSGKKVTGIDPFGTFAEYLVCTKGERGSWKWYTGVGMYVYNKTLSNGKVVQSFKVQPQGGQIKLSYSPSTTTSWYVTWYYDGLDDTSVYKVTFSWDYPSITGNGYVSYIIGSPFWLPWDTTTTDYTSTRAWYKYVVRYANGTDIEISNPFVTSISKNSEWLNVTLAIDMTKLGTGTQPTVLYIIAPNDYHVDSPTEYVLDANYPLVMKIAFVSGYTVSEDDALSITWHIHLIEG